VLALALEQLRAVGAQFPLGIDEAVESLARDAQLLAQVADLGVAALPDLHAAGPPGARRPANCFASEVAAIREGLSSPESSKLTDENPSLSWLSEDMTAAIVLLQCAEDKMFNLLPREEFASPT
jgi:hypothetical protein